MGIIDRLRGLVGQGGPKWECTDCGTVHRKNPKKCKNCGNTVLIQKRD